MKIYSACLASVSIENGRKLTDDPIVYSAIRMLCGHVLDPCLHSVRAEGAIAAGGQAEKGCRFKMLRALVVAQAGRVLEALLAVGTVVVHVTVVFLKFLVPVE